MLWLQHLFEPEVLQHFGEDALPLRRSCQWRVPHLIALDASHIDEVVDHSLLLVSSNRVPLFWGERAEEDD